MIKALIIEPPNLGAVGWWRLYAPLQMMRQLYPRDFDFEIKQDFQEGELMRYDWLILARPSKEIEMQMVATAKKLGVKVCVDYDDDLMNIQQMHPAYGTFLSRQKEIAACVYVADVVWTSTPSIKQSIGREDAIVIPNAIRAEWLPDKPAPITKSAAWRGQPTQYIDVALQAWASGWYDRIKDMPDTWYWFGWMPWPTSKAVKHVFHKQESIVKYWDYIKSTGINLLWKPLYEQSVFNHGKSNISWIEATVGGGVCVTNYTGHPGWEHCIPDFDFSEKVIFEKWEESRTAIQENYNLATTARARFESLVQK